MKALRETPSMQGFSLIELVVSITVSVIVTGFVAVFLTQPVDMYMANSRRAELADARDNASVHLDEDLRGALPHSARVSANGFAVEYLQVLDSGRYSQGTGIAGRDLNMGNAATQFVTLNALKIPSGRYHLVVNNGGTPGADAYTLVNVITPVAVDTTVNTAAPANAGESLAQFNPAFTFNNDSPNHRIYFVSGPVTYLCDPGAQTLIRYSQYAITPNQANVDTVAELSALGAASSLVATHVSACAFRIPGPGANVVTIDVTFSTPASTGAETLRLFRQVQLENIP
jgi:MSHA biogenesis protein MshO